MKTPEEIKKALELCTRGSNEKLTECEGCPYYVDSQFLCSIIAMMKDALTYLHQLEETIMMMKIQMRGDCGCCKHGRDGDMARCNKCLTEKGYHPLWEYEGLPEVKAHDKSV